MMNFERVNRTEDADVDRAYEKARETLSDAINIEDFGDIYKDVGRDKAYVERMEKEFEKSYASSPKEFQRVQKMARILEAIVHKQGELSNWFGENAVTITPARYDDIRNGIDDIVEFQEGESSASHLALAIDVVSGPEIRDKLARIRDDINDGRLSEIKYFKSEHLNIKGKKTNVPRVVVGADRRSVTELMELWLGNRKKELDGHHIQIQILKEIEAELEKFIEYAEKIGQTNVASVYGKTLRIIRGILKSKMASREVVERVEEDEVYLSIKSYLKNFIMEE